MSVLKFVTCCFLGRKMQCIENDGERSRLAAPIPWLVCEGVVFFPLAAALMSTE